MFAKSIVLSDVFLGMPATSQLLYYQLGMNADDDGFVGNPHSIVRQCCATEDDLKVLIAKRFVLTFPSDVIVIKHWRLNNYIQKDRYRRTTYIEELMTLELDEKMAYIESKNPCIQNVYNMYTQYRLGKGRKGYINKQDKTHYSDNDEIKIDQKELDRLLKERNIKNAKSTNSDIGDDNACGIY